MIVLHFPAMSFAACSNPAGNEADIMYNGDYHIPQFCDGTNWMQMGQKQGAGGGACTAPAPPAVGTVMPDGSVYAGLSVDGNVPMYATRCDAGQTWSGSACTGTRSGIPWNNGTTNWIDEGYENTTAGRANTTGLAALADAASPYYAATQCENLNEDGHTDWYLPAENELATLYSGQAAIGNFDTSGNWYWTSTENSSPYAWLERFSDGGQNTSTKYNAFAVRCVRKNPTTYSEGDIIYNAVEKVPQFCGGANWIAMAKGYPDGNLIAYWKFDDGSGASASDSAGTNTGTLINSPTWTTSGKINGALIFNGTNNYVSIPSFASNDTAMTYAYWVYIASADTQNAYARTIQVGGDINSTPTDGISHELNGADYPGSNMLAIRNWSAGVSATLGAITLNYDAWNNVIETVNGNNVTVYLNGIQVLAGSGTRTTGDQPVLIGAAHNHYFKGTIDDARVYNRALSAADAYTLYVSMGGTSGNINSNLIGYWKFDETSGASAADSSGNGNTGTTYNSPTWGAGKINNALTFNGTNQYVDAGTSSIFNLANSPFTVAAWVKLNAFDDSGTYSVRMIIRDTDANNAWQLDATDPTQAGSPYNQFVFTVLQGGVEHTVATGQVNTGQWYHVVGVSDGTYVSIYLNGILQGPNPHNSIISAGTSTNLYIGARTDLVGFTNGTIDDVRIYNRPLSAAQVMDLYNNTVASEGDITYNHDYCVPQYYDGAQWKAIGKPHVRSCDGTCVPMTSATAPAVGTACPDGSVYAGLSTDGNVPMYTQRCDAGQTWSGSACTGMRTGIAWSAGGTIATGYTSLDTGQANTAALAALSNADSPYSAAITCKSLNEDGHTDWYLPAMNELNVLYLGKAAIGNFDTSGTYYWSSSEGYPASAAEEDFSAGIQGGDYKYDSFFVRCARR
jgi:hypothetical protein